MKLLDTTFLVDFLRRRPEARRVVQAMEDAGERPVTTEVNAFEIAEAAYAEGRLNRAILAHVQQFLGRLDVFVLDRAGALRSAEIAATLRAKGRPVGVLDVLVAGIALASGCDTIITRDKAYERIPGVKVETY